ncbi:exocyst complex component 1-like isoform X2 [Pomacea canaliculata]|uniref:exocyst complex component 1-like isoform X2 n=1 Tax=Pomacea canaliculata TaxID=400727 RepID=UPI000D73D4DE|nr:exocyst complex component 1-like isoform X2 [Pomacea canaliculata]
MAGEDFQALSAKEEADLELLMSECQIAMSNAELFAEQLSKQLSVLDGANIHSIMGSEDQVLNLMRLLDEGIQMAESIEEKLTSYDLILANVKEQMEVMQDKETLVTRRNTNHQRLLEHLDHLINQLDLDMKHMKALMDGDLTSPSGIYECTVAAQALHKCMNAEIHPSMLKMAAVEEQQKRFRKLSSKFSQRLAHHLNNQFIHQGNEIGGTLSRLAGELRMPQHESTHKELVIYAELMLWLKNMDQPVFQALATVYTDSLSKLYVQEVRDFFESVKQRLMVREGKGKHGTLKLSGSTSSLTKIGHDGRSVSMQSVDSAHPATHVYGSESDLAARNLFDQVLEKVLQELERVCIAEQDFCFRFFHLMDKSASPIPEQAVSNKDGESGGTEDVWQLQTSAANERQINDEVRAMMAELFPTLETELEAFLSYAERQDSMYTMYMLVRISQHVINNQHMGSFLGKTFGNYLIKVKRGFDKYIDMMIQGIREVRVSKKNRCGIISFVHQFEEFANLAEAIFKGSDRHTDLNKAYTKLVHVLYEQIQRVASEHQKTPREVVLMENFHRMFSILSHLKNAGLEADRKEAKQRYTDNMLAYTITLLGRPLEKLHIFFEGVEARVAAGVKREEVGFQLAFSKQELRKVIREYPGKEVKKTLEHLYKKVEKQLCEEENLLQVVWHEMQDVFINQYKHYDELMKKCYPDSQLGLEFTIENVLQYFSDIAQSH